MRIGGLAQVALLSVAAFFNAVMDKVGDEVHFNQSVFKNLDPKFWSKDVSWQYAIRIFGYKVDAWHLSKSAMIVCFCVALVIPRATKFKWWVEVLIAGAIWNIVFNISYHFL